MKKDEKTELTRNKIISAALVEFGTNGYKGATLNNICATGISKGLLYHNYKNKEEVYIECVKKSFFDLLNELHSIGENGSLENYLNVRLRFFKENPYKSNIIFEIILADNSNFGDEIKTVKKEFDNFNLEYFKIVLNNVKLRKGVSKQECAAYFSLIQSAFNVYLGSSDFRLLSVSERTAKHEEILSKFLDFILYGIAERGEK